MEKLGAPIIGFFDVVSCAAALLVRSASESMEAMIVNVATSVWRFMDTLAVGGGNGSWHLSATKKAGAVWGDAIAR
jgi:hypothetical protein